MSIELIIVVGVAVAALLVIIVPPWRRVRAEKPLPPDVEAQVLLGEPPEQITSAAPERAPRRPRPDHPAPPQAS